MDMQYKCIQIKLGSLDIIHYSTDPCVFHVLSFVSPDGAASSCPRVHVLSILAVEHLPAHPAGVEGVALAAPVHVKHGSTCKAATWGEDS